MKDSKRSGTDAKKPKKYVYNDQLQFLNKLYEVRETVDSLNDETRHGTENNSEHIEVEANASFTIDETINKRTRNRKHRKPDEVELKILKALEPEKQNSKMSFFQSLLPHLDRFDENELLQFQMGVLQVIANINEKKKMVPQVPPPFPQSIPTHSHSQQFAFQLAPSFPQHSQLTQSQSSTPSFTQLFPTQSSSTNNNQIQSTRQYYQDCGASSGMTSPMTDPRDSSTPLSQDFSTVDSVDFTSL